MGGERLQKKTQTQTCCFPFVTLGIQKQVNKKFRWKSTQCLLIWQQVLLNLPSTSFLHFATSLLHAENDLWLFRVTEQNWLLLSILTDFHVLHFKMHITGLPCNRSLCYTDMLIGSVVLTVLNCWYGAGGCLCVQSLYSTLAERGLQVAPADAATSNWSVILKSLTPLREGNEAQQLEGNSLWHDYINPKLH